MGSPCVPPQYLGIGRGVFEYCKSISANHPYGDRVMSQHLMLQVV